jgi:hypothetical protein
MEDSGHGYLNPKFERKHSLSSWLKQISAARGRGGHGGELEHDNSVVMLPIDLAPPGSWDRLQRVQRTQTCRP